MLTSRARTSLDFCQIGCLHQTLALIQHGMAPAMFVIGTTVCIVRMPFHARTMKGDMCIGQLDCLAQQSVDAFMVTGNRRYKRHVQPFLQFVDVDDTLAVSYFIIHVQRPDQRYVTLFELERKQ